MKNHIFIHSFLFLLISYIPIFGNFDVPDSIFKDIPRHNPPPPSLSPFSSLSNNAHIYNPYGAYNNQSFGNNNVAPNSLGIGAPLGIAATAAAMYLSSEYQAAASRDNYMYSREAQEAEERREKQYGGEPHDWVKMRSKNYTSTDNTQFEMHWVENIKTKQRVNMKTKLLGKNTGKRK